MNIRDFYNGLDFAKNKPILVLGKTKTPVAEYDMFTKKIIINKEKINKFMTN